MFYHVLNLSRKCEVLMTSRLPDPNMKHVIDDPTGIRSGSWTEFKLDRLRRASPTHCSFIFVPDSRLLGRCR